MTHITIRQTGDPSATPNAEISFDGGAGWPVTVQNPFGAEDEQRLAWYFEQWLQFPFTDGVKAQAAAASVRRYGETLFAQTLRGHEQIYSRYRQALGLGVGTLHFQLVGDPDFHALHWETLWDPDRPRPLILDAAMIRSTVQPVVHSVTVQPSPTINLLLVTARPHGGRDVGYRTIQRPLVEMLRASQLPVQVDLVRPGTWRALVDHLAATRRQRGVGHYQIIHFDLHGAVLSRRQLAEVKGVEPHSYKVRLAERYARADLSDPSPPTSDAERDTAWLFFEDETSDDLDAASAEEVAGLLLDHQIPIAILNACQSGQETGDPETGLGSRLLAAGVQTVVAMGYSVTVSAATRLMATLYQQLFQPPHDLLGALAAGRTALHHDKTRKAAYNQLIKLEDWLLPVLYQPSRQTPRQLPLRAMSFEEQIAFYSRQATRYTPPEPEYGFVGRDVDILQIEKRLLATSEGKRRNLLLIQGMGGAGKSTLLRHLAGWWQTTGLVDEVFYFGYDERAYTLAHLLDAIARQLLNRTIPDGAVVSREFAAFQAMQPKLQATLLAQKLRSERHLLILDNLESVTGDPLAIPNTLPPAEQTALRGFLADLLDGQTLVLLGSRGNAAWLRSRSLRQAQGTGGRPAVELVETPAPLRDVDVYALPGLDAEAAANLAERILHRHVTDPNQRDTYAASPAFGRLLKLLDGSPLALEVVLSNLAYQSPDAILSALETGDVTIDDRRPTTADETMARRTESILACIDYAHSNLDAEAQRLLFCLFPFTGVVGVDPKWFNNYIKHLKTQPFLADLPFDRWGEVLQAAQNWGVLTLHNELTGFLHLQPVLPYFLKTRLAQEPDIVKEAIETAFRLYYSDLGLMMWIVMEAEQAQDRHLAMVHVQIEYENLSTAMQLSLAATESFFNDFNALYKYLLAMGDHQRCLTLCETVLASQANYIPAQFEGEIGTEFYLVYNRLAHTLYAIREYEKSRMVCEQSLQIISNLKAINTEMRAEYQAVTYHQLGLLAEVQREWEQAETYYQQALVFRKKCNDGYFQAHTYHQLGVLAEKQREWEQAEAYTQQALTLFVEFNDRYHQAMSYRQLGVIAHRRRKWEQAEHYFLQSLKINIEFNNRYGQAHDYHDLGVVAKEQGKWRQAETYFRQSLALRIELNDRYEQAGTYYALGIVAREQREWAQAEMYYKNALDLYIVYNDRYHQAGTYQELGIVAQAQQKWRQAEAYYQQALALCIEDGTRYEQACTYHQLGSMAAEQREWERAEAYYEQALALKIEYNDRYSQASTYHGLGVVLLAQQKLKQAEAQYQQALALCIDLDEHYNEALALHALGSVAYNQENFQQAEEYFQKAISRYIDFGEQYWLANAYGRLGEVAVKQEQWQQAYDCFTHALTIYLKFEGDEYLEIAKNSLRRLWQAHPDESVLPTLAQVLGG